MTALADLSAAGVAVWLDDLSRERLRSGNLAELVRDKEVVGVTTNPSIFQKALSDGAAYDEQVRDLALRGTDVGEAVRMLTTYDVRWACDVMREVHDRTDGVDGRVSIEVDPAVAHDPDRRWPRPRRCGGWSTGRTSTSRSLPPRPDCRPSPRCSQRGSASTSR
jgi:transaldolase